MLPTLILLMASAEAMTSLEQLRANAEAMDERAPCSVTVVYDGTFEGEREQTTERYDRGTQTWTLLQKDGAAPTPEVLDEYAEGTADRDAPVDHYQNSLELIEAPLEWQSEDNGTHIFYTDDLPRNMLKVNNRDISRQSAIEVHLSDDGGDPVLQRTNAWNTSTIRIPLIARVDLFRTETAFEHIEGYGMVVSDVDVVFEVDALGRDRGGSFTARYVDYDCPAL